MFNKYIILSISDAELHSLHYMSHRSTWVYEHAHFLALMCNDTLNAYIFFFLLHEFMKVP